MLSVLIPAFNEEESIRETIERVRGTLERADVEHEIVVIDDGSEDSTAERAEACDVQVVRHPANGGYGRALKTGMRVAKYDWCAILDADGSYPIERLPDLLAWVPRFDMVVGERTGVHYWGSRSKRIGRRLLLLLVRFVVGTPVPDVNSGMRIFRKEIALAHARRISSGFSFTTTLTLAMLLDEHFLKFVPIDYHARVGRSKVRTWKDSLRVLQIVSQAILYYNPLKLFLPICIVCVLGGALGGAALALLDPLAGVLFAGAGTLAGLAVGAIGLLAEALRLHRSSGTSGGG